MTHPTDEQMAAYIDENLKDLELEEVEQHIVRCARCWEIFVGTLRTLDVESSSESTRCFRCGALRSWTGHNDGLCPRCNRKLRELVTMKENIPRPGFIDRLEYAIWTLVAVLIIAFGFTVRNC